MAKFIHLYKTVEAFDADYNGENYLEPWLSLSPKLTVTGLTMEDQFCFTYGATWEYECERDAVDMEGGAPGPMGTQHVYEWSYIDTSMQEPVTLHAATLVRNPSVGTQIFESGENYGEWFFVSTNPANIVTVSGTPSEHLDKVDYNKKQPEEKYIRIEWSYGDGDYTTVETNLTCEDLEQTGNTYKAYLTEQYEGEEPVESEWDVVFDYEDEYYGNVWKLMNDGQPHGTCFVVCNDGDVMAHMFA